MDKYLKYIIVAIIQGLTEILPISSRAHIIIIENFFNINTNDLSFSIFLHLASSIAILIFYHKDIFKLFNEGTKYIFSRRKEYKSSFNYLMYLIIATIPAAIGGIFFQSYIESYLITPFLIGMFLTSTGIILLLNKKLSNKCIRSLNYFSALEIGLFQMIGIIPGISRSGITLFGTTIFKINKNESARFVFLLLLPISIGSSILEISKSLISGTTNLTFISPEYLISFVVCIVVTLFSLFTMFKIIKKEKTYLFSYYLIPLGILMMIKGLYINTFIIL